MAATGWLLQQAMQAHQVRVVKGRDADVLRFRQGHT
jgi:hypothetical protein